MVTESRSVVASGKGWRERWITKGLKETFENNGNVCFTDRGGYTGHVKTDQIVQFKHVHFIVLQWYLNKIVPKIRGGKENPIYWQR